MTNYIEEYNAKIQSGEITAGVWIKRLYEYIIKGLEEESFFYAADKAENVITWIEKHAFHTEGPLAPQQLQLALWQKAFLSILYGIVDDAGKRQFREAVLIIARKNGKTLLSAAIAKYEWYCGDEFGTRVFCTAPKLDQADLVYNSVWNMTILDPDWQKLKAEVASGIKYHERKQVDDSDLAKHRQSDLYIASKNAVIKKVAFSERKSDGYNPSLVICDEIAAWEGAKGLKQYEVYKSAAGAREMGENPTIILSCSTSGYVNDSIYDELIKRSSRFLLGESKETKLLPLLYMIDDVEKWNDIEELKKSNPNLGVSVSAEYLQEEIAIAEGSLSKKSEFLTKYCNIKQNSSLAWLDSSDIEEAFSDIPLKLEDFRGCYCVGGIDLSQTTDLTSCCIVIEKNGELYVFSKFFLPESKIEEAIARDAVPYKIYIQQGFLDTSGDAFVDYKDCFNWFISLVRDYKIYPLQVGYDRYSAQYLVQDLQQNGFHMDDVFQGFNLTPVIRETEGVIKEGRIHCGNNNLLKLHLYNSALKKDAELNKVRLIKLNANDHIDGTAALLDAMCVRQKWYGELKGQLQNEGR